MRRWIKKFLSAELKLKKETRVNFVVLKNGVFLRKVFFFNELYHS